MTAALTDYVPLAREANQFAFQRLPPGVYHSQYEPTKKRLIGTWQAYQKELAAREGG